MVKPITTVPHSILTKYAVSVEKIDKEIIKLILDMVDTFRAQDKPKAVGLAANQIGRPEKIFLALINKKIVPFINPEILESSKEFLEPEGKKDHPLEGCLSIPGYFGEVKRPKWIRIKYQTLIPPFSVLPKSKDPKHFKFEEREETIEGFPATIIQHEVDHLEGHVFTEKLLTQNGKLYKIVKNKEGKEEFEEVPL